jgi:DNA-binding CsgD family transcriptional regulator
VERARALVAGAGEVQGAREVPQAYADSARLDELRGRLEAATGSALQGYEILVRGAERILKVAPTRAAAMLLAAVRAASVAGDMDRVVRAGQLATRLMEGQDRPASASIAAGIAELVAGSGGGGVATLEEGIGAIQDANDPELLCDAAAAAVFTGDYTRTRLLASRAASRCRETGALGTLAQALEALVIAQMDTNPRQAAASADEGLRAARETDQVASEAIHLAILAAVAAFRGDRPTTEELAAQVIELDRAHGLAYPAAMAVAALCVLELGLGRPAQALQHYETLSTARGHRVAQLAATDFAMLAAVWSGRQDRARELLTTVGSWRWVREADSEWAAATLDRWRAMVAEGDEATALFERSLANQRRSARPFFEALTHLLLGEHLRRMRQRSAARPHFRTAMEIFERLDAVPWLIRARNELRATGEFVRRRDDGTERLTPQELQVAQLVATGASTKAVAAQLYLSPRTVDSHLRQIFTKLGISSRAALRDVDLTG